MLITIIITTYREHSIIVNPKEKSTSDISIINDHGFDLDELLSDGCHRSGYESSPEEDDGSFIYQGEYFETIAN